MVFSLYTASFLEKQALMKRKEGKKHMSAAVLPFVKTSDWIKVTPQLDKMVWEKLKHDCLPHRLKILN